MEMISKFQASAALLPLEDPGTHWVGGLLSLQAGLDVMEKTEIYLLPEIEPWIFHPVV